MLKTQHNILAKINNETIEVMVTDQLPKGTMLFVTPHDMRLIEGLLPERGERRKTLKLKVPIINLIVGVSVSIWRRPQ